MKRLLAIGAVSVLGALSIASAAALTVNGGAVQAGQDNTLACDPNGVEIAYTLGVFAPAAPPNSGFPVTGVSVSDIDANCVGKTIDVVLTNLAGAQIATGSIAIGGTPQAVVTAPAVDAFLVEDVHIAIH